MDLFEILKQFKNIEPNSATKEISKRAILAVPPSITPRGGVMLGIRQTLGSIFETGVAVALVVFFIMAIAGQFSSSPYIAPIQLSVINPGTLHAEAQAIDIQIKLAELSYQESTTTAASTVRMAPVIKLKQPSVLAKPATSSTLSVTPATATSTQDTATSTMSVDQALEQLAQ